MSSRNKTDVKKLFEYWCEVSRAHGIVDRSARNATAATPAGVIVESFPESFRDVKTITDIPAFAYPCEFESDSVQSYSFVLTTDDSKWRFGFCRHDPKTNSVMVIITYLPWHDTFLRFLTVLADLRRTDNNDFQTFLAEAYNRGIPDPGGNLKLFYNGGQSYFVFERPLQFQLPSIPENHNLNLYYNFVDPKNMIAVFAAMLAERRIIFTSRRLDRLSSCIQAANAFLYPMVWQHIFIPVLPMKLKDYLMAPMPYLIGVPEMVLETMTPDELGEVVILNCDTKIFESPYDDVHQLPAEIVSHLKKQLSHSHEHIGDRVSKIFLGVLVQLIGGYRDAVEFRESGKTFNRDKFIESRPSHLRPFLTEMMKLQIFQQFIDERIDMLNTGLGFSDEFELETVRYAEKMKKRGRNYAFLKNVKDKTNPAVKSAVKSVKEGSRGVKTAYKDLKSKFRDVTPPNSTHFRSHLTSNSQHDRIDGYVVSKSSIAGHHSAPSSPIFTKRTAGVSINNGGAAVGARTTAGGFQYASPDIINGAAKSIRRPTPLGMSNSSAHIHSNGYATSAAHSAALHSAHVAASPTVSPASSLCSSEMNLSQELQNHPLFKTPIVDRSLKPSNSLELNNHQLQHHHHHHHYHQQHRITATRTGGPQPPARPPLPMAHALQAIQTQTFAGVAAHSSYYNHPYASASLSASSMQQQLPPPPPPPPSSSTSSSSSSSSSSSLSSQQTMSRALVMQQQQQQQQEKHLFSNGIAIQKHTPKSTLSIPISSKIVTTGSIFDRPPEVQSPPVPPRRMQCNINANSNIYNNASNNIIAATAAVVHAGLNRLERNCWQDYADHSLLENDALRDSGSSNESANASASSGSSSASFVSATSTLSEHPLNCGGSDGGAAAAGGGGGGVGVVAGDRVPVPAPRQKKEKESLRSLQPQHLQVSPQPTGSSLHSVAQSISSQEDTMNDLISLDDSNNTSFDLEDFDPLNQNARPLPLVCNGTSTSTSTRMNGGVNKKSTTLPSHSTAKLMTASSISNPLYPYFTPKPARPLRPPTVKPPPLPTSGPPPMPPPDEDFELLRKYGLDQFTLTTTNTNAPTTNGTNATAIATAAGMSNWTTFE